MLAMPSRVMSSSVGPRPPIAMTTSDLRHARSSVSVRRVRSSPTMVTNLSSSPNSGRRWPSHDELVSCVSPMRSSVPTAMISVFMSPLPRNHGTREYSTGARPARAARGGRLTAHGEPVEPPSFLRRQEPRSPGAPPSFQRRLESRACGASAPLRRPTPANSWPP